MGSHGHALRLSSPDFHWQALDEQAIPYLIMQLLGSWCESVSVVRLYFAYMISRMDHISFSLNKWVPALAPNNNSLLLMSPPSHACSEALLV